MRWPATGIIAVLVRAHRVHFPRLARKQVHGLPPAVIVGGRHLGVGGQYGQQEVRDAVECVAGLDFSQDLDPERGWRVIVKVRIRGDKALVVLYPADDPIGDVWRLGSAYFTRR